ncbi:DarT ssDNA thymidine ADP-ribosyltransferase family protein [uncultured Alistipes sp.]|jgi:hypothetical protein|uniref:DarT ssDNA thymidine ADP-ribosyltransferase family protein n=1 Tax=uncultured Alistipes sp. TaxID=538949 RepID=UPI00259A1C83|nr:DarT ssDNA thymidine ADP-ribosyltransferase family protein [uncultured Alistipes sp.]
MEPVRIVSNIVDAKSFQDDKLQIRLSDMIDGYRRKSGDSCNERCSVSCVYFKKAIFRNVCAVSNKDFYLCDIARRIDDATLESLCIGAEIEFARTECFDKDGVGYGFKTELLKISLPEERKKECLDAIKSKIKEECVPVFEPVYKENMAEYRRILEENGVRRLYHFTNRENLASIKKHGGLFSWFYCELNDWDIPKPGGNPDSRSLDVRYGLHNYVRLSFCSDHPMQARLDGDLVLLEIDPEVALWEGTLYSDKNAADSKHCHGDDLGILHSIRFDATRKTYVSQCDPDFKYHQAEVMVRTHIPSRYILNLDN